MIFNLSRDVHLVSLGNEVKAREGYLGVISLEVKIENKCEHHEAEYRRRSYGQRTYNILIFWEPKEQCKRDITLDTNQFRLEELNRNFYCGTSQSF